MVSFTDINEINFEIFNVGKYGQEIFFPNSKPFWAIIIFKLLFEEKCIFCYRLRHHDSKVFSL